jgi:hypothetical protein
VATAKTDEATVATVKINNQVFEVRISKEEIKWITELSAEVSPDSIKDMFADALSLLLWARKQVKNGRIIASIDEKNKRYRELQMPFMQHLKQQVKKSP